MSSSKVCYIWDKQLISECDRLPAVLKRASMVHDLICSYGLLDKLTVVLSKPATYDDLKEFHAAMYLDHLKTIKQVDEDYEISAEDAEQGIGYDCTPVTDMYGLVSTLAGGSVVAARSLILGAADVAINWCGGWHHAQRFEAEGFCYVNDIVIAIEKLRRHFPKVLYIDLDVHHGNGVEDAYCISRSVFTLSFHKWEPGFYPGSGAVSDTGSLAGRGYVCNVPYKDGLSDQSLCYLFESILDLVVQRFTPSAVVVQCGADVLAHDPLGGANVTPDAVCRCVGQTLKLKKPTLLLGGGGYVPANAARLWAQVTALTVGAELPSDIPEHEHFLQYGPDYTLDVPASLRRDQNDKPYLDSCIAKIKENLDMYLPQTNR